jgi:hypothetical protein
VAAGEDLLRKTMTPMTIPAKAPAASLAAVLAPLLDAASTRGKVKARRAKSVAMIVWSMMLVVWCGGGKEEGGRKREGPRQLLLFIAQCDRLDGPRSASCCHVRSWVARPVAQWPVVWLVARGTHITHI